MACEIDEIQSSSSSSPVLSEISLSYEEYQLEEHSAKLLINPLEVERELTYPLPKAHYQQVLARILSGWKRKINENEKWEKIFRTGYKRSRKGKRLAYCACVTVLLIILVICLPIVFHKSNKVKEAPTDDNYALALKKALLFFDAQKSGHLPKNNRVPWRRNSCLYEPKNLVGGFYDGGDAIKYTFPAAFSITMLSWSVIEYPHKYRAIGEFEHVREIIKWGTDYLLRTFDSSSNETVNMIYTQVGNLPDDAFCWERPEDIEYKRRVQSTTVAPDVAGELIAALSSASIVFREDPTYATQLVKAAEKLVDFCRLPRNHFTYSSMDKNASYPSSDFYDESIWGATWLFYATGKYEYLMQANEEKLAKQAKVFSGRYVFSFDNKLPGALLLLTRIRVILGLPYPYEDMLQRYHKVTEDTMCSYLRRYDVFNFTKGGLILLNNGGPRPFQYAANAAYISAVFAGYLKSQGIPAWSCGPDHIGVEMLQTFATSQVDYILGVNPKNLSYVIGYGRYPTHVHHRGASIPDDGKSYGCTEGFKWRDNPGPNPHNITGAMMGGPDSLDRFRDLRSKKEFTEPTLVGNAGLVAALVALTNNGGTGVDVNSMFSEVQGLSPPSPPPPSPWDPLHG